MPFCFSLQALPFERHSIETIEAFKAIGDSDIDSENEVDVALFKNCTKNQFFIFQEDDVSSISVKDIIRRLPDTTLHIQEKGSFTNLSNDQFLKCTSTCWIILYFFRPAQLLFGRKMMMLSIDLVILVLFRVYCSFFKRSLVRKSIPIPELLCVRTYFSLVYCTYFKSNIPFLASIIDIYVSAWKRSWKILAQVHTWL